MFEQSKEVKEIYAIFQKSGISHDELEHLLEEICIDEKKTEARIGDLALCVLIKNGFTIEHLKRLSIKLLPRRCRPLRLINKIKDLSYIVKKYKS